MSAKVIETVATISPKIKRIRRTLSANVWMSGLTNFEMVHDKKLSFPQILKVNRIIGTVSSYMLYIIGLAACLSESNLEKKDAEFDSKVSHSFKTAK